MKIKKGDRVKVIAGRSKGKVGDVLHVKFKVGAMRASNSKPGWGIVVLPSELINQRGEVVQKGEHRLMIPRRPA